MKERNSRPQDAAVVDLPVGEAAMPDVARAASTLMNGWNAVGEQWLRLAQSTLQTNLEAAEALRQCQSPQEMLDAQMRYGRRAWDQWLDGTSRIASMAARVSGDAAAALTTPRPSA